MATRVEQKEETKQRLLAAARALFSANGFEATTIKAIAAKAGVATGTVLSHYGSKLDLLLQIAALSSHDQVEMAQRTLPAQAPVFERIMHVMRIYYGYDLEQAALVAHVASYSWVWPGETEEETGRLFEGGDRLVAGILEQGVARGELTDDFDRQMVTKMIFALYMRNLRWAIYAKADVNATVGRIEPQIALILSALRVGSPKPCGEHPSARRQPSQGSATFNPI